MTTIKEMLIEHYKQIVEIVTSCENKNVLEKMGGICAIKDMYKIELNG